MIKNKKEITNEGLAQLLQKGLADVNGKLEKGLADVNGKLEKGLADVNGKLEKGLADVNEKNDELARMVQAGFSDMDKRFEQVDKRFEQVDKRFEQIDERFEQVDKRFETVDDRFRNIDAHLTMLSRDVGEIRQNFVYRHEFDDVLARVKLIENKLKIRSGK